MAGLTAKDRSSGASSLRNACGLRVGLGGSLFGRLLEAGQCEASRLLFGVFLAGTGGHSEDVVQTFGRRPLDGNHKALAMIGPGLRRNLIAGLTQAVRLKIFLQRRFMIAD